MNEEIKFEIKMGKYYYPIEDIEEMLKKLFNKKGVNRIILEPEEKTFKVTAFDEIGNRVKDTRCPPNIKEATILGFYYNKTNLCLMPLRDSSFVLKKGCRHNKTVRPLFSLYKNKEGVN